MENSKKKLKTEKKSRVKEKPTRSSAFEEVTEDGDIDSDNDEASADNSNAEDSHEDNDDNMNCKPSDDLPQRIRPLCRKAELLCVNISEHLNLPQIIQSLEGASGCLTNTYNLILREISKGPKSLNLPECLSSNLDHSFYRIEDITDTFRILFGVELKTKIRNKTKTIYSLADALVTKFGPHEDREEG